MLSEQIARFTTGLQFADLPAAVVRMAKLAILDWLGSAVGGSAEPPAQILAKIVREAGGNSQATLIGFNEKTSVLGAALVNGAASHILELDDLHKSSILHPAAPIIPAAAALAEKEGCTGKEFITAVVAGYEIGIRIAEAVTPSHYYYWHTTGTCGTFGAAIAAAKICRLTAEQIVHALGSAGSQAAGLWEFLEDGAMTKHLHPGKAALNGILAVLAAREGFTGASKILEGKKGYFRATAPEFFPERATSGLGQEYRILGNSYKIYPSCRHTHGGVDLALDLAEAGLDPRDIEKITIRTYAIAKDIVGNARPSTPYEAKFSLPYCVSRAFLNKNLVLDSFLPEKIEDRAVRDLMSRCTVEADPGIDSLYPQKWPTALEVALAGGQILHRRTDFPKGDPENPASAEDLTEKFRRLAAARWSEQDISQTLRDLENLENLENLEPVFYKK